ncbi:lamin tail domain-containing protein [bacterium]|nr:lamin tail domain-containing protein [bacterium]
MEPIFTHGSVNTQDAGKRRDHMKTKTGKRIAPMKSSLLAWMRMSITCLCFAVSMHRAMASADSVVVFNEVQYHPAAEGVEWIELRNLMGVKVDLSGWKLAGGIELLFEEGTGIEGRGLLLVAAVPLHPDLKGKDVHPTAFTGRLDNGGDSIRLENNSGRIMDRIDYQDDGDWPVGADGSGATLAKRKENTAEGGPRNWRASLELGGTPGQPNVRTLESSPSEFNLVSLDSRWRFLTESDPPPTRWRESDFDDQDWTEGAGAFHAGKEWTGSVGGGPSAYWPLDASSGIRARNLAGDIDGRLRNGPSWVTDSERGPVLEFDGINDYVTTGISVPQITLENDFTWSFWAYSMKPGNVNVIIGNRYNPDGADFSPREFIKFTSAAFEFHRSSSSEDIDYPDFPVNVWAHHAVTKQGPRLTYFRNGISMGVQVISSGLNHPQPLYFGGDQDRESWKGRLDDVAIWKTALPSESIQGLADETLKPNTAPTTTGGVGGLGTKLTGDSSTAYFRKRFTFTGAPDRTTASFRVLAADGVVLYLNGIEIHRANLPTEEINHATRANEVVLQPAFSQTYFLTEGALRVGENILSAEIHMSEANLENLIFGLSLNTITAPVNTSEAVSIAFNEISAASDPSFQAEMVNRSSITGEFKGLEIRSSSGSIKELSNISSLSSDAWHSLSEQELNFRPTLGDRLFLVDTVRGLLLDSVKVTDRLRGRSSQHDGRWLYPSEATFGSANIFEFHSNIVINEIMYHPRPLVATPGVPETVDITPLVGWGADWLVNESGRDPGSDWASRRHSLSGDWKKGRGLIAWETGSLPYPVDTLLTRPSLNDPFVVTHYFQTEFDVTQEQLAVLTEIEMIHLIDDGAVFYLNGTEVFRYGMSDGKVDHDTLAMRGGEATLSSAVSIPAELLHVGSNQISVEVHQTSLNSSDVVFGLTLNAVEEIVPAIPGLPFRRSDNQWIEVWNQGDVSVDMSKWVFDDGVRFEFPSGTVLAPNEYSIVAGDAHAFTEAYPAVSVIGQWSGSLSRRGERLRLSDAYGNPADELYYLDDAPWPAMADGGGSSLELADPRSENHLPGAWHPGKVEGPWRTYTYQGRATQSPNDPTIYHEFIFGLLDAGEFLIDDISVRQDPEGANTELIQNGHFNSGDATRWRMLGNHSNYEVIDDPQDPNNRVLWVRASGATEHMSNHAETTLKSGRSFVSISSNRDYKISFRAKWLGGSNQLNTRLYFNRLARTTILDAPQDGGTPGRLNSARVSNAGPTFSDLRHEPAIPVEGESVHVFVKTGDPDGVASVQLFHAVNGDPFQMTSMRLSDAGEWSGKIPSQAFGAKIQFYVEATDHLGMTTTHPEGGSTSRAIVPYNDGQADLDLGACQPMNLRIVMTDADTGKLHRRTNVMSNDRLGCTIIVDEREVYYNCGVRLKGSEHGRAKNVRAGFLLRFPADQPFLGAHRTVAVDRSGAGDQFSQKEIMVKHAINHAGNIPGMYDDLIRVIAPRSQHTGSAMLLKSRYDAEYLDNQFINGSDGAMFEYELIYTLRETTGGFEGLKLTQDGGTHGVPVRNLGGSNKELYRWHWLVENNRDADDYGPLIDVLTAMGQSGRTYQEEMDRLLDVDQWLRSFAIQSLFGIGDNYSSGARHNAIIYIRPSDGKALLFPWDMDFTFNRNASSSLTPNTDLNRLISASPKNKRAFYGHVWDIVESTFNVDYMTEWAEHYSCFLPSEDLTRFLSYINTRRSTAVNEVNRIIAPTNYRITTADNVSSPEKVASIQGRGWVDLHEIRSASGALLPMDWVNETTWRVQVPIDPGENIISLSAFDRAGKSLGTDSVRIIGTGLSALASMENLAITEVMYHPADPSERERAEGIFDGESFEFVELTNISDRTHVDLTGTAFTSGIRFALPSLALEPGQRIVVAGNSKAFETRYGSTLQKIGNFHSAESNRLSNSGERLTLSDASQREIASFEWSDEAPWPEDADGDSYSLVLMTPWISDPTSPESWRTSADSGGNPGGDDAIRLLSWMAEHALVGLDGDRDKDGRTELLEYVLGSDPDIPDPSSAFDIKLESLQSDGNYLTIAFEHRLGADDFLTIPLISHDLKAWTEDVEYAGRTNLGAGMGLIVYRATLDASPFARQFIRFEMEPLVRE